MRSSTHRVVPLELVTLAPVMLLSLIFMMKNQRNLVHLGKKGVMRGVMVKDSSRSVSQYPARRLHLPIPVVAEPSGVGSPPCKVSQSF